VAEPFSREEVQRRWSKTRHMMAAAGLNAILATSYPACYWLSGAPVHPFGRPLGTLLPVDAEPAMIVSIIERAHLESQSWIDDRRYYWDYNPEPRYEHPRPPLHSLAQRLGDLLAERGLTRARLGIEEAVLPAGALDLLRSALPEVAFQPASELLASARRTLSDEELRLLRAADDVCDVGQEVLIEQLAAGRTARDIWDASRARMMDAIVERYPEYPFGMRIHTGLESPRRGSGHSEWIGWEAKASPRQGQVLTTGVDVLFWGYQGNVERTVVVGTPTPQVRAEFDVMVDTNETAIAAVRPGVRLADVDRACKNVFTRHGFGTRSGSGLGRGIVSYEANARDPSMDVRLYADAVLEPGMAFSIEPDLLSEGRTYRHCNTLIVTPSGAEVDSRLPRGVLVV